MPNKPEIRPSIPARPFANKFDVQRSRGRSAERRPRTSSISAGATTTTTNNMDSPKRRRTDQRHDDGAGGSEAKTSTVSSPRNTKEDPNKFNRPNLFRRSRDRTRNHRERERRAQQKMHKKSPKLLEKPVSSTGPAHVKDTDRNRVKSQVPFTSRKSSNPAAIVGSLYQIRTTITLPALQYAENPNCNSAANVEPPDDASTVKVTVPVVDSSVQPAEQHRSPTPLPKAKPQSQPPKRMFDMFDDDPPTVDAVPPAETVQESLTPPLLASVASPMTAQMSADESRSLLFDEYERFVNSTVSNDRSDKDTEDGGADVFEDRGPSMSAIADAVATIIAAPQPPSSSSSSSSSTSPSSSSTSSSSSSSPTSSSRSNSPTPVVSRSPSYQRDTKVTLAEDECRSTTPPLPACVVPSALLDIGDEGDDEIYGRVAQLKAAFLAQMQRLKQSKPDGDDDNDIAAAGEADADGTIDAVASASANTSEGVLPEHRPTISLVITRKAPIIASPVTVTKALGDAAAPFTTKRKISREDEDQSQPESTAKIRRQRSTSRQPPTSSRAVRRSRSKSRRRHGSRSRRTSSKTDTDSSKDKSKATAGRQRSRSRSRDHRKSQRTERRRRSASASKPAKSVHSAQPAKRQSRQSRSPSAISTQKKRSRRSRSISSNRTRSANRKNRSDASLKSVDRSKSPPQQRDAKPPLFSTASRLQHQRSQRSHTPGKMSRCHSITLSPIPWRHQRKRELTPIELDSLRFGTGPAKTAASAAAPPPADGFKAETTHYNHHHHHGNVRAGQHSPTPDAAAAAPPQSPTVGGEHSSPYHHQHKAHGSQHRPHRPHTPSPDGAGQTEPAMVPQPQQHFDAQPPQHHAYANNLSHPPPIQHAHHVHHHNQHQHMSHHHLPPHQHQHHHYNHLQHQHQHHQPNNVQHHHHHHHQQPPPPLHSSPMPGRQVHIPRVVAVVAGSQPPPHGPGTGFGPAVVAYTAQHHQRAVGAAATWSEVYGRPQDGDAIGTPTYVFDGPPPPMASSNLVEIRAVTIEQQQHQQQHHQQQHQHNVFSQVPPFVLQKGNVLEIVPKEPTVGAMQQQPPPSPMSAANASTASVTAEPASSPAIQPVPAPVPAPVAPPAMPPSPATTAALALVLEQRQRRKAERDRRRMEKFMRHETIRVRIRELYAEHAQLDDEIRATMGAANGPIGKGTITAAVPEEAPAIGEDVDEAALKSESPVSDEVRVSAVPTEAYKRARYNPLAPVGKSCLRQPAKCPIQLAAATADGPEPAAPEPAELAVPDNISSTTPPSPDEPLPATPPPSATTTTTTTVDGAQTPSPLTPVPTPNKPAAGGVLFADGIRPGCGTSDSDSNNDSPLPLRSRNRRAIQRRLNRRCTAKRAARMSIDIANRAAAAAQAQAAADELAELQNLPPPPPPLGQPPAHLAQPQLRPGRGIRSAADGGDEVMPPLVYFHYNPRDNRMYVSPEPDPIVAFQQQNPQQQQQQPTPPQAAASPAAAVASPLPLPPLLQHPPPALQMPPPQSAAIVQSMLTSMPPPPSPSNTGTASTPSPPQPLPTPTVASTSTVPTGFPLLPPPTPPTSMMFNHNAQHLPSPGPAAIGQRRRMTYAAAEPPMGVVLQSHPAHHRPPGFVYQHRPNMLTPPPLAVRPFPPPHIQQQQQQQQPLQMRHSMPLHHHHPPIGGGPMMLPPPTLPPALAAGSPAAHPPLPSMLSHLPPPPLPQTQTQLIHMQPPPPSLIQIPMPPMPLPVHQRRNSVANFGGAAAGPPPALLPTPTQPPPPAQAQ